MSGWSIIRWRHAAILLLLAIAATLYFWLFLDSKVPDSALPDPGIAALRSAADAQAGPHPVRVDAIVTAASHRMGNLERAGAGLKPMRHPLTGFVIGYANEPPVVIDTGIRRQDAGDVGATVFSSRRRATLDKAMRAARAIVLTGNDVEHASGLANIASDQTVARPTDSDIGKWTIIPVAPGISAIARGPNAIVFVRFANGAEVLFTGSQAVDTLAWQRQAVAARWQTDWVASQDRTVAKGWLTLIHHLARENPALIVVPGRDLSPLRDAVSRPVRIRGAVHDEVVTTPDLYETMP